MHKTYDLHVVATQPLLSPAFIHSVLPITEKAADLVTKTRDCIRNILQGKDRRLLVIVGPCSIHDVSAAYEYGEKLSLLRAELRDQLEIVMRVYFEKPRTTTGWKGLINDPHLDSSFDINTGLRLARKLLLDLAHLGLPAATELLDPIIPQYIADLVSWTAIGARTTESQTHREMASGLSMPVGFKNGTDGSLGTAINAMLAASHPHCFLGINSHGLASIVTTTGNPDGQLVLRGGKHGPNYAANHVENAIAELTQYGLNPRVMVDCSHGNSSKDYTRQPVVLQSVAEQVAADSRHLMGVMIESHLVAGNQQIPQDLSQLVYGQSITDACIDFATTTEMLRTLAVGFGKVFDLRLEYERSCWNNVVFPVGMSGSSTVTKSFSFSHLPVLSQELIGGLAVRGGGHYLDATVGGSGHSRLILAMAEDIQITAIDRDAQALKAAQACLRVYGDQVHFWQGNFADYDPGETRFDGILADLGVSSAQFDQPERGFSFRHEAPLDMRMDQRQSLSAADLVNQAPEAELADIFYTYGEERFSRRIARRIVVKRPIYTTTELAAVVAQALPHASDHKKRDRRSRRRTIHPATRVFQALRIAVNQELVALEVFLSRAPSWLKPGGRIGVISFHSLEDRIAKQALRAAPELQVLTKKPIIPQADEIAVNPRSRSAKLRLAQRQN